MHPGATSSAQDGPLGTLLSLFPRCPLGVADLEGRRVVTGHPVDVATGELYSTETEFVMGGPVPVAWERFWLSSSDHDGMLGRKWHHPLDIELAETPEYSLLRLEHGRLILLPRMQPGQSFYHRAEQLTATRESDASGMHPVWQRLRRRGSGREDAERPGVHGDPGGDTDGGGHVGGEADPSEERRGSGDEKQERQGGHARERHPRILSHCRPTPVA